MTTTLCISDLRGRCPRESCPQVHSKDRAAALAELSAKRTTQVCQYFRAEACKYGDACHNLHVLVYPPSRLVPPVVRLASQARGKAKTLHEALRQCPRTPEETKTQLKEFEDRFRGLVTDLETALAALDFKPFLAAA